MIASDLMEIEPKQAVRAIEHIKRLVEEHKIHTLAPLLPLLLNLEGKPYSLRDHFPFETFFSTWMPRKLVWKTARQVSKSTSLASHGLILSSAVPYFKTLYVTPLFEQIRRFSNNYVRPFIEQSPIKSLLINSKTENSVLQRSFSNWSVMYFSYAFLDADRTRGIKADKVAFDECQDLNPDFIPVILETMSHAREGFGIAQFTGTPKTKDNTLEKLWSKSSQGEWAIPCMNCKHLNFPVLGVDLQKMIGPVRSDISEHLPGVICAKCRLPVHPRLGRWVHRYPEKRYTFAGYHVPQILMPIHYSNPEKWSILVGKQNSMQASVFHNEVLGESYDLSTKLLSQTDLERAGCLNVNDENVAVGLINKYTMRVLAIDWGGGGEDGVSFTTVAVLGLNNNGVIDVIFGAKSLTPHDHLGEAAWCLHYFNKFQCSLACHDYTGAGSLRETFMIQAGLPRQRCLPVQYVRTASRNIINFVPATVQHPRDYYRIDKARSLQLTCYAIKLGYIRLFRYDYENDEAPGLLHDFLALIENKIDTGRGAGEVYSIVRNENFSDDLAHCVNLGACLIWHSTSSWPRFSEAQVKLAGPLTEEQDQAINGVWSGAMNEL